MHFKIKNIQICHHFIRDYVHKDDIALKFIQTDLQLVEIFTKSLDEKWSVFIYKELDMFDPSKNSP